MASVLLIEDNDELRVILKTGSERSGHVVITASGGLEGLEIIKSQIIDVVVTDIVMPLGRSCSFHPVVPAGLI